jgi:opacity protein-like surface antigen
MLPNLRFALLAAVAMPMAPALAADYDPPIVIDAAEEYVPVEVGSGWYLRGDIAYVANKDSRNTFFAVTPAAFSESEDPIFGSVGVGYHFSDYFRVDANIGYIPGFSQSVAVASPAVTATGSVDNHSWTAMLNGYVDLGTYVGITPYLSAGIGVIQSNYELNANHLAGGVATAYAADETKYSMAYSVGAGVAYNVSKNVALDIGYQYINAPDAETISIRDYNSFPVKEGQDYHQVKVGLRYDLW